MSTIVSNGQVALVTGANSGIGRVTARELALRGYHVFLACRSESKTRIVLDEIAELSGGTAKAEFLPLDLGDLGSVRRCAEAFLAKGLPLHLLIANAGLAGHRGVSASGFELTFGVCHVGHFLLTRLLTDTLRSSAPARIVVVASEIHRRAKELARHLAGTGVTTYALHPGTVASDVWRSVPWPVAPLIKRFMLTEAQGARTTLYCATAPELARETGYYYENCLLEPSSELSEDEGLAKQLWVQSERWTASARNAGTNAA